MAQTQTGTMGGLIAALLPPLYDTIELTYSGDDLTSVVCKLNGEVVGTLTLTYVGGKLVTATRL